LRRSGGCRFPRSGATGSGKIKNEKERTLTENKSGETNGYQIPGPSNLSKDNPFKKLTRVPPPQSQNEAIEWLKTAANNLGLDSNKYNDPDMISQLINNNAINSIEEAENAVQKAQEMLEKFKLAYGLQKR